MCSVVVVWSTRLVPSTNPMDDPCWIFGWRMKMNSVQKCPEEGNLAGILAVDVGGGRESRVEL